MGGGGGGPRRKRGEIEGGGCGGVVGKAEGVWGVVHKVEGGGDTGVGGERSGGTRVCTHATSVREEVCVAPPSENYRRVGTQPAWSWGPVGSSTMGRPHLDDGIDRGQGR
jgi:hypothetical protein